MFKNKSPSIDPPLNQVSTCLHERQTSLLFIRLLLFVLKKDCACIGTSLQSLPNQTQDVANSDHRFCMPPRLIQSTPALASVYEPSSTRSGTTLKQIRASSILQQAKLILQQGVDKVRQTVHMDSSLINHNTNQFMSGIEYSLWRIEGMQRYWDKAATLLADYIDIMNFACCAKDSMKPIVAL